MGRGVAWSLADIAELERLAAEGLAVTAIYKLKRGIWTRSSIQKKLIQIKKTGSAKNNYRGRAEKMRQGDLDFADAEMELHPRHSVAELAAAIKMERGVACGRTTVWRAMRLKLGRHAYKVNKYPKLSECNQKCRYDCCKRWYDRFNARLRRQRWHSNLPRQILSMLPSSVTSCSATKSFLNAERQR